MLTPLLSPDATVLDFGCGPGFLAREIDARVREVIALDVSRGTLACARALNPGPSYVLSPGPGLPVGDGRIDFVYSVAVFQHLDPVDWPAYFREFRRVLRPGGSGLCHFAISDEQPAAYRKPRGLRGCYSLRFEESTTEAVVDSLTEAGFADVVVTAMTDVGGIDDDVGRQHMVTFRRAPAA